MGRIRKFLALPRSEQALLARTWLALAAVRLGLRFFSFEKLLRWLEAKSRVKAGVKPDPSLVDKVTWAVSLASRYVPGSTCLSRALTARFFLLRHGFPARLEIGVNRDKGEGFEAHAWVEVEGKVVLGGVADLSRFSKLPPLPHKLYQS